jgi:hypothetical protein
VSAEQIAFQITFASVDSGDGSDPLERTERMLREERVLAAVRGSEGGTATVLLPITEGADVVALDDGGLLRFDLSAVRLGALLAAQGLTLRLGLADDAPDAADDALGQVDAELEQEFGEAFEQLDDAADDLPGFGMPDAGDAGLFAPDPVRVAEFSRRGPWAARLTAQLLDTPVDYLEDSAWSVYRYRTDRAHGAIAGGRSDGPVIEVNVPPQGEAWVEVSGPHGRAAMFWPNAERLTRPVLDPDSISVPESAELYRRMLQEIDGAGDELAELDMGSAVDADAVRRACLPETLGGVAGPDARVRALVLAFGVPRSLVAAGLDDTAGGRRFAPQGWPRTAGDVVMGGLVEFASLTDRGRPAVRFARFLRKRPLLGAALSTAELALGVALGRGRSRAGRGLGILLVVDALADLVLWTLRIRRR